MRVGPGTIIGGYRIVRALGAGGMGTVFLGKHPSLPRFDAVKVLGSDAGDDREFRGRFEREANLAAALDHPNIVAVYNRGEDHGRLWIAMQFVEGTDAAAALAADPAAMTPARALRIVTEVGRALDHAHDRGLLHRDVKPANFMLSPDSAGEERVLLADFGLAKAVDDAVELTRTGTILATIAYASPEQLSGLPLDRHADIYSLACSFFKLVTDRNPFPGTQAAVVMAAHLYEPPPRLTELRPELPPAVDQVLAVALDKDPRARFHSCHEFVTALSRALTDGESVLSARTEPRRALRKRPVRRGWVALAAAVVVVLGAGAALWAQRGETGVPAANPPVSSAAAPVSAAEARKQNPAFLGKSIAAVDVTGVDGNRPDVAVHLRPGPQAAFLEALGFTYHHRCVRSGDEPTPRPLDSTYDADAGVLAEVDSGFLLAVRSDSNAGRGGLVHLPQLITLRRATVLVLDDPVAVEAFRTWSADSERILLDTLLPILRKQVR